ncbi:MAG: class I SAM-dependent methyltransferase [Acidimicrobiales bacterium]
MTAEASLRSRIADHAQWYHTLDLGRGLETPGWFDLRGVVDKVGLPASLAGARCLDVATFDGFWAFEMERRGAREVVGIDLLDPRQWDWPVLKTERAWEATAPRKGVGDGFVLAREALASKVERLELSVYDLDPAAVGAFDFVYVGSLLLHLRDPIRALERVRSVCSGTALIVDAIDPVSTLWTRRPTAVLDGRERPWWWKPNMAGLRRMVESAGFSVIGRSRWVFLPPGRGQDRVPWKAVRHEAGRAGVLRTRVGDPHGAIAARPVPAD